MKKSLVTWVSRKLRGDAWLDFVGAAAALVGGVLILIVSYYVTFGITWFVLVFPWRTPDATLWARIAGGVVIGLAFLESWRDQRRLFDQITGEVGGEWAALSAGLYLLGVGWGPRRLIPLAPATSRNLVRVLADALCSGPRLLTNSVRLVRRGRARATADYDACARVLAMAMKNPGRLPFRKIRKAYPGMNLLAVAEQLSWLNGVVVLPSDPVGVTLTDETREELARVVSRGRQAT